MRIPLRAVSIGIMLMSAVSASAGVHLPVPYMSQPDDQTCLPTSLLMALHFMGRSDEFSSATVQDLHKYCQYNRFNAPEIARGFGLYALPNWHNLGWTRETVKHELSMGRPVVLGLNQGRSGHFVLAIGYTDDDKVIIHNPTFSTATYGLGGPDRVAEWDDLLWRGGIILRPEPFPESPALSGVAVNRKGEPLERTVDLHLTERDDAEVSFTLLNNGREPWPTPLFLSPVDPDSSPTQAVSSAQHHESWLDPHRVTDDLSGLDAGTTRTIAFKVRAPETAQSTTSLQYYNLHDKDGNWFGNHWLAGPGHRNIGVRIIAQPRKETRAQLPLIETMADGSPSLAWGVKHGGISLADSFTTASPAGEPIGRLYAPDNPFSTAWLGEPDWQDYRIEGWIYCDLRREQKNQGYERVGLFARDNGQHMADNKNETEIGQCLAMAFDSDDGKLRAGNIFNGVIRDYREKSLRLEESGWHHFAITCKGDEITYELDGEPFHKETGVRGFRNGECGVFFSSAYDPEAAEEAGPRGAYFSALKVTQPE